MHTSTNSESRGGWLRFNERGRSQSVYRSNWWQAKEISGLHNSLSFNSVFSLNPLYALSPILILNQIPTVSTFIPDQTAPIGGAFTYTFSDTTFVDADSDTITYSAEIPDAAWITFNPATRTFSGTPTAADVGFITVTVTASDGMDSVTDEFSVAVAMQFSLGRPPEPQTVSADFALKPSEDFAAGGTFRLLFVTTQTTDATSADIDTYNAFVQTSAAVGHSDIRGFSDQFRALISTEAVDARVNTATNLALDSDPLGTDTDAPIYWLGSGDQVATGYGDFYDGGWSSSMAGRDQNGDTYIFATPMRPTIWTGSEDDGQGAVDDSESRVAGASGRAVRIGQLEASKEISGLHNSLSFNSVFSLNPLYALSPILTLNQIPTVSTPIPDQYAPIGAAFAYTFSATTFADAGGGDALTYSAEIPDAAWLTFNPATRTFSGTPTAAGVITITVTASDGMDDSVPDEFTVTALGLTLTPTSLTLSEGTTATYTAILTSRPTTDTVTVTITGTNTYVRTLPPALTFTTGNWDSAQSIMLIAVDDPDADDR